jgi:hypothetical protein
MDHVEKLKNNLSQLSILVVNYKYDLREDNDLVEMCKDEEVSKVFRDFPGLGIKFGLANPEENEWGGVYIFKDEASLEADLASPILKEWAANPDVSELTYKKYKTLGEFTRNTIKPNFMTGDFIKDLDPVGELVNN